MSSVNETFVVAVSGGVDSVVLLDMLVNAGDKKMVVAHFDHGIRDESAEDRKFVEGLAKKYGVDFEYGEGRLGANTSEAVARKARYDFLRKVKEQYNATAIITAHHEDDVLETAILNLLRGTGRKGLSSLGSTKDISRPLLNISKQALINYALAHSLEWREDATNDTDAYTRNYVRHRIVPKFDDAARQKFKKIINLAKRQNDELDKLLSNQLGSDSLDRPAFILLPHAVSLEVMAAWLRAGGIRDFDRILLEKLVVAGKTYATGKQADINRAYVLHIGKDKLSLTKRRSEAVNSSYANS